MTALSLPGNALSGQIPAEIGDLTALNHLVLEGNRLNGPIPPELGDLPALYALMLGGCELTGGIPPALGRLATLTSLELRGNPLGGTLPPELGDLSALRWANLASIGASGTIPPQYGDLAALEHLMLGGNQLTGGIPPELGRLAALRTLDLPGNKLSGPIPAALGDLSQLNSLVIHNNQLSGAIPPEFGGLDNVYELSLSGNALTGGLPPQLGDMERLVYCYLGKNQLSGPIPPELGGLATLVVLDLGGNQLSGTIPVAMGDLFSLGALYLDNNQLSGSVPAELVNLRVGFLDIGHNALWTRSGDVRALLDAQDPDWRETQTVAPNDVRIAAWDGTAVDLAWTPIRYAEDGGTYEVAYSTQPDGPFTLHGTTVDKSADTYRVDAVPLGTSYWAVRTHTPAHDEQQSDLWSEYGPSHMVPPAEGDKVVHVPLIEGGRPSNSLYGITLDPASPETLANYASVIVNVYYDMAWDGNLRIYAQGLNQGSRVGGYHATAVSPGRGTASCSFTHLDGTVDQVRIRMQDARDAEIVYEVTLDVDYVFGDGQ